MVAGGGGVDEDKEVPDGGQDTDVPVVSSVVINIRPQVIVREHGTHCCPESPRLLLLLLRVHSPWFLPPADFLATRSPATDFRSRSPRARMR